jgi:hypothetical protein
MKIIAFYLPQFHEIPENNLWWGKGFTEWVNVKKATVLVHGQRQPRIPLNNFYYDLSDSTVLSWQIKIAKEHGIYAFCFYHYWLSGHLLLEKPVELFLSNPEYDIPFCLSWANHNWTNAWVSSETKILLEQKYGDPSEWKEHFLYLLPFFRDKRYINNHGKPLLLIYDPSSIDQLDKMLTYLNQCAIDYGFKGIDFAYQSLAYRLSGKDDTMFRYNIEYQPQFARGLIAQNKFTNLRKAKRKLVDFLREKFHLFIRLDKFNKLSVQTYDQIWKFILNMKPKDKNSVPGAFVDWDNTPRRGVLGSITSGACPSKFHEYLSLQIKRARDVYKTDMIFMFAWNEWAEGGYLEPDEENGFGNLEAIRDALRENNEFPIWDADSKEGGNYEKSIYSNTVKNYSQSME